MVYVVLPQVAHFARSILLATCGSGADILPHESAAMKLPNGTRAVVDIRKLRDYCLDPHSPKGRNKARVFVAALGLTQRDAEFLRQGLLRAAAERECRPGEVDEYGRRYTVDFVLQTDRGRQRVRSGWIVRQDEHFPRLTTCFVLTSKPGKI